jgi:hypothetical protein
LIVKRILALDSNLLIEKLEPRATI